MMYWGLYDFTKFKQGATWYGQPVNVVNKPGSLYHGTLFVYNDPTKFISPPNKWVPYPQEGYAAMTFDQTSVDGIPWQMVVLPPPPEESDSVHNPNNPQMPIINWNRYDWPEDAKFQHAVLYGYISHAVNRSFYAAPPGAPYVPLYAHLARYGA